MNGESPPSQTAPSSADTSATGAGAGLMSECVVRGAKSADEFREKDGRHNGALVTNNPAYGLTPLRNLMCARIHDDVERVFGMGSMLAPVSNERSETRAKTEIGIFQIAVSADEAQGQSYFQFSENWYPLWRDRLRLGEAIEWDRLRWRLERYLTLPPAARRLMFCCTCYPRRAARG